MPDFATAMSILGGASSGQTTGAEPAPNPVALSDDIFKRKMAILDAGINGQSSAAQQPGQEATAPAPIKPAIGGLVPSPEHFIGKIISSISGNNSAAERAGQGVRDPLDAGAQMLVHGAHALGIDEPLNAVLGDKFAPTAAQFDKSLANNEADIQARRAAAGSAGVDWWRLGGNMVGTAPLTAIMPSSAGTGIGSAIATGAKQGAIMGAFNPVTDRPEDFWGKKTNQAIAGAAVGGITGGALNLADRAISPNVNPDVRELMNRGITPTPGQTMGGEFGRLEEKASSIPIVGDMIKTAQGRSINDFNRAVYGEVLKPIGETAPQEVGRGAIDAVGRKIGNVYDTLLPKLKFSADPQFTQELNNLTELSQFMTPDKATQFTRIMENKVTPRLGNSGKMDGLSFKAMENELGGYIKRFSGSTSADDQILGDALKQVRQTFMDTLQRSNPMFKKQLGDANLSWAMFSRLRDAAGRIGAEEGIFTPAQFLSAVRAGDKSVGKGAFARGDALLQDLAESGKKVLGNKYPDSGTAGRIAAVGLGVMGAHNPIGVGAAAAGMSLPYTPVGQRAAAYLLTQRPDVAPQIAAALKTARFPLTVATVNGLLGSGALPRTPGALLAPAP